MPPLANRTVNCMESFRLTLFLVSDIDSHILLLKILNDVIREA